MERTARSSIFNFSLTAITFVVAAGIVALFWRSPMTISRQSIPQSPEYYLTFSETFYDHQILYYGLEGTSEPLEKADVLILGNSRVMFGLQKPELEPVFRRLGLSFYSIAFGYSEMNRFAEAVLAKHALKPKWIIVNADRFFTDRVSPYGQAALDNGHFAAWKYVFEGHTTFWARRFLHGFLPYLLPNPLRYARFRSRLDGTVITPPEIDENLIDGRVVDHPLVAEASEKLSAERFVNEMQSKGIKVIFTYVPTPESSPEYTAELARAVGVPHVSPKVEGLACFDATHLNRASARRFGAAWAAEIEKVIIRGPL